MQGFDRDRRGRCRLVSAPRCWCGTGRSMLQKNKKARCGIQRVLLCTAGIIDLCYQGAGMAALLLCATRHHHTASAPSSDWAQGAMIRRFTLRCCASLSNTTRAAPVLLVRRRHHPASARHRCRLKVNMGVIFDRASFGRMLKRKVQ